MNIVLVDLEATCFEASVHFDRNESEIIEIGAVKLNDDFDITDEFQIFIMPEQHPVLSEYCTKLTSIKQDDIQSATDFHTAMSKFESWCGETPLFMSWGNYDRDQIIRECDKKHYKGQMSKLVQNHINVKWRISKQENISKLGFGKALRRFNMTFEGTPHRGIDDAKNMARVAKMYKNILMAG